MGRVAGFALLLSALPAAGQNPTFEFHAQATTITQTHGPFHAPYSGVNSLRPIRETDTSLTATLFFTFRYRGTGLIFNPELAGGTGFSGVAGVAGFPNGEIPRVGKATPTPYVARLYLQQKLGRFTTSLGRFAATDFFDNNSISHDPRTQFMNWSLMANGAWDYPADTRGYSIGAVEEVAFGGPVLRIGSFLEPTTANGPNLDRHFAASRGDIVEWQQPYPHGGILRLLAYVNRANMGTYRLAASDIVATRKSGTIKYGFGVNVEQRLSKEIGIFSRLGWNDGKTESWAFTEIDRTATAGISIRAFGLAVAVNGISGDHRAYLARGGYGFIIGDGRLDHYGPETILEVYYAWRVLKLLTVTPDYQFIANPAYNRDRGPVSVASLRFHFEL